MNSTVQLIHTAGWSQLDPSAANTNNTSTEVGQINYQFNYNSGNGTGCINEVYHQYVTMPSGGTGNYNLAALVQNILGYNVTKGFTKVKGVEFKNYSTVSGANININVSSSSGFKQPFGYPTGLISLEANTSFGHNSVYGGWDVSASGPRQIQLIDAGLGATYEIAIWGITG